AIRRCGAPVRSRTRPWPRRRRSCARTRPGRVPTAAASGAVAAAAGSCLRGPGVAQGHAAVEHGRAGPMVAAVGDEIAVALELERLLRYRFRRGRLDVAVGGAPRVRVDEIAVAAAVAVVR